MWMEPPSGAESCFGWLTSYSAFELHFVELPEGGREREKPQSGGGGGWGQRESLRPAGTLTQGQKCDRW